MDHHILNSQFFATMLNAVESAQNSSTSCPVVFIIGLPLDGKASIFKLLCDNNFENASKFRNIKTGDVTYLELLNGFKVKQLFEHNNKKYSYKVVQFLFVTKYASFSSADFQNYIQTTVEDIKLPLILRSSLIVTDIPTDIYSKGSAIISEAIMQNISVNSSGRQDSINYFDALIDKGSYIFSPYGTFPTKASIISLVDKTGFFMTYPSYPNTDLNKWQLITTQLQVHTFKEGYKKIVFVLGPDLAFMDYITYKDKNNYTFKDDYNHVFYVLVELNKIASVLSLIETLQHKIQIVFVYEVFYHDLFELYMNQFNECVYTLSPSNRVLLTQHISIVNMDPPSRTLSRYKFSIGVFKLQYKEDQRYYSISKPSQGSTIIQTPADVRIKLGNDDCFVQLIKPADQNLDSVTMQVLSPVILCICAFCLLFSIFYFFCS